VIDTALRTRLQSRYAFRGNRMTASIPRVDMHRASFPVNGQIKSGLTGGSRDQIEIPLAYLGSGFVCSAKICIWTGIF